MPGEVRVQDKIKQHVSTQLNILQGSFETKVQAIFIMVLGVEQSGFSFKRQREVNKAVILGMRSLLSDPKNHDVFNGVSNANISQAQLHCIVRELLLKELHELYQKEVGENTAHAQHDKNFRTKYIAAKNRLKGWHKYSNKASGRTAVLVGIASVLVLSLICVAIYVGQCVKDKDGKASFHFVVDGAAWGVVGALGFVFNLMLCACNLPNICITKPNSNWNIEKGERRLLFFNQKGLLISEARLNNLVDFGMDKLASNNDDITASVGAAISL